MEEEDHHVFESPSSPKHKVNSCFPIALPAFFHCYHHHHHNHQQLPKSTIDWSSSLHHKWRSHDQLPSKEKRTNLVSKMGRHHRRHSADFHYDQHSYSLNFEDDRDFKARLPPPLPSPRPRTPTPSTTTITGVTALS